MNTLSDLTLPLGKPMANTVTAPPPSPIEVQGSSNEEALLDLARQVVNDLLARTGIPITVTLPAQYAVVEERVRATVATWDVGDIPTARLERYIVSGIQLGAVGYAHTALETQVLIGLYTVCGLSVDDGECDAGALAEFAIRLQTGRPQLLPILDRFAEVLAQMPDFFNVYLATTVLTDSLNFVNSTLFEKDLEGMQMRPAAGQYPQYKRARNGLGEVFAAYIWDKFSFPDVSTIIQALPDAIIFLIHGNDILSFYKEELGGDTKNFIHDRARVTGKDTHTVVRELLEDVVASVHSARAILEGEEREAWERFMAGYISFHLVTPRYKLASLIEGGA
ncbi:hypothetical protein PsYK624_126830 [Phanerochaete sordida]|uniref:Terpenoid synthase n=1 Tax=Phanerochaete sordida TaxID=48140 RepID=A0A9P3GK69_9APHY|nr:hypothetical protein PsYK624_126830 [Phanerochaete sordida]